MKNYIQSLIVASVLAFVGISYAAEDAALDEGAVVEEAAPAATDVDTSLEGLGEEVVDESAADEEAVDEDAADEGATDPKE